MSCLHPCWWQRVMWIVWGSASWAACSRSARHPSHVRDMHSERTPANCICYHQSNLYLAIAYAPFYEDIAMLIILDHPIDYGLNRNRGSTSLGPGGLFAEP